ncbi:hypothetical protein ACSVDA_14865 [Cytobacillus sp. Hm23]
MFKKGTATEEQDVVEKMLRTLDVYVLLSENEKQQLMQERPF